MRHASRFMATITGIALLFIATTTTAYATLDPGGGVDGGSVDIYQIPDSGTSLWQYLPVAAIAALLTLAVVGLVASLRHARLSRHARPTRPSPMSHA